LLKGVALFILRRLSMQLALASGLARTREMLSLTASITNRRPQLPTCATAPLSPTRISRTRPVERLLHCANRRTADGSESAIAAGVV